MEGAAKRLFDDLLSIEVNTLIKPGMTGRKMPAVGHALLDIFGEYDTWTCECSGRLNPPWSRFVRSAAADPFVAAMRERGEFEDSHLIEDGALVRGLPVRSLFDESRPITADDFQKLRDLAATSLEMHRALRAHGVTLPPSDATMIRRIMRNCDQLMPILQAPSPAATSASVGLSRDMRSGITGDADEKEFSGDEIITIRKAWELGTEVIVMQTVVQLDGDVVTRLNEAKVAVEEGPLRDVHREGVSTALGHWNSLVRTFVTITGQLMDYLR